MSNGSSVNNRSLLEELADLAAAIDKLTTRERLDLAATLLEAGHDELAAAIVRRAIDTHAARRLIGPRPSRPTS